MSIKPSTKFKLIRLSKAKQQRLDILMDKNNEGTITPQEYQELKALVQDANQISVANAKLLAEHNGYPFAD